MTSARLNHELKMYAKPAKIISATAKNRQIIIPAKVRYAGPITSKPKKEDKEIYKKGQFLFESSSQSSILLEIVENWNKK